MPQLTISSNLKRNNADLMFLSNNFTLKTQNSSLLNDANLNLTSNQFNEVIFFLFYLIINLIINKKTFLN